jgi:hypothetical protein
MRAVLALAFLLVAGTAQAQLRVSFVGYSATSTPRPVGFFDETAHDSLLIDVSGMYGYGPDGWYLSWSAVSHQKNGYPTLLPTDAWAACGEPKNVDWFDVILWLEPGELMLGQQVPFRSGDDRVAVVYGDDWEGHNPWDFTHLRVVLVGQTGETFQGPYCLRTYLIPIVWLEQPVASESSTFGKIKALYRTKGE